jgi:hypothetical protein
MRRLHGRGSREAAEAERDLRAAQLAEHVRRIVDRIPPLTDEQRALVVASLSPTAAAAAENDDTDQRAAG